MATDLAKTNLAEFRLARRSANTALRVIREVAAGLAHAHGQRVLHRDVKPENIMIFADGRAALGDFGASRFAAPATRAYTEAGTFGYIAPEQAYGRARFSSDVFSLGLIAYEILTGFLPTWPFEWPPDRHRTFMAKVPEPVRPVLRKAAQFDPRRRWDDGSSSPRRSSARSPRSTRTRRPRRAAAASRARPSCRRSRWRPRRSGARTAAGSSCASAATAAMDRSPSRWRTAPGAAARATRSRT
jgi:serine/threonine-protein kinase